MLTYILFIWIFLLLLNLGWLLGQQERAFLQLIPRVRLHELFFSSIAGVRRQSYFLVLSGLNLTLSDSTLTTSSLLELWTLTKLIRIYILLRTGHFEILLVRAHSNGGKRLHLSALSWMYGRPTLLREAAYNRLGPLLLSVLLLQLTVFFMRLSPWLSVRISFLLQVLQNEQTALVVLDLDRLLLEMSVFETILDLVLMRRNFHVICYFHYVTDILAGPAVLGHNGFGTLAV